jgi:hypothetical protein
MDAWIGLIGVLVGTFLTLVANFALNERQRKHELNKIEIENINERRQFLREKYEELVTTVYQINNLILDQLNEYDGTPKPILDSNYHEKGLRVQTLVSTYFQSLNEIVIDFASMAHDLNETILDNNSSEISKKMYKLDSIRKNVLEEVIRYAGKYT